MHSELIASLMTVPVPAYDLKLSAKLSDAERARHVRNEATIERTLLSFEECSDALLDERDNFLFRETHLTFEAYCRDRWKIGARRARQIVAGGQVLKNLRNPGSTPPTVLPTNEKQTRPLVSLPAEKQREVWKEAVDDAGGAEPTARQVKAAKEKVAPPSWTEDDMERWIPIAVKIFRIMPPLKDLNVHVLMEHPDGGWSYNNASAIFDAMVERGLVKDCRLVEPAKEESGKWPRPNEHGVYRDSDAEMLVFRHSLAQAAVRVLQAGEFEWISTFECSYKTGSHATTANGLSRTRGDTFSDRGTALHRALRGLRDDASQTERSKSGEVTAKQRRVAKLIVAWCGTELRKIESGPVKIDPKPEPTKAIVATGKPLQLKTAQTIYAIGMEAAGINIPWGQAKHHTQIAMLAIAEWHLAAIADVQAGISTPRREVAKPRAKKKRSVLGRVAMAALSKARWKKVKQRR